MSKNTNSQKQTERKWYVSMTDKFLSGWGGAENKIAKYVVECDSYQEAEIVADNANARSDQKNVNICYNKPYYNSRSYRVKYQDKKELPSWFVAGYFRQQAADEKKKELEQ